MAPEREFPKRVAESAMLARQVRQMHRRIIRLIENKVGEL